MIGHIHSIQSLGTVDGPGVRFVAFLQGCPLRCGCCHNPDTWSFDGGEELAPAALVEKTVRCKAYFGKQGGITLSGGEPLMQPEFCKEVFTLCHENGINTCLDTSGCVMNEGVGELLRVTDRVLLDIKYTKDEDYRSHVGCEMQKPLAFLKVLAEMGIPTVLRQVIIPTLTDRKENVLCLKALAEQHPNVEKIELLPFRKLCEQKYEGMGIPFPFGHLPEPSAETMRQLNALL